MTKTNSFPFRDGCAALRLLLEGLDQTVAWRLGMSILLAVSGGALAGVAPLAFKEMIDAAGASKPGAAPAAIGMFGAAYLLCLCIGRLMNEARPLLLGAAEQRMYARLRSRYFSHLLDLPLGFHLGSRSGALVHSLQQAISGYQIIVFSLVNSVAPVLVEGLTVIMVLNSLALPVLTAIVGATAVAYFLVLSLHMNELGASAHAVSKASIDVHSTLADGLINYEPIKCFGTERLTLQAFNRCTVQLEQCWSRLQQRRLIQGLTTTAVFAVAMAACLAVTTHHVTNGSLTVGGFVLANLYMLQLVRPLEMLSSAARDVAQSLAFIRPLIDVLAARPETAHGDKHGISGNPAGNPIQREGRLAKPTHLRQSPRVTFRSVQLAFDGAEPLLKNFNLDVTAGRSMAIVGASGCGKSTLIRLLLRLCQPRCGSILLDDVDIDTLPVAQLRSMIAVVPQDVVLLNTTVADNIRMGSMAATRHDIERAARLAGLEAFISGLPCGYNTAIGERGLKLSGGERQRIAIARAILRDPLVYVFDEATSMLDAPTELAIMRNLREISGRRTTIMIAHRLSAIRSVDDIAVVAEGRVVEQGDHAALLSLGGVYARMWRAQQSGIST